MKQLERIEILKNIQNEIIKEKSKILEDILEYLNYLLNLDYYKYNTDYVTADTNYYLIYIKNQTENYKDNINNFRLDTILRIKQFIIKETNSSLEKNGFGSHNYKYYTRRKKIKKLLNN